MPGVTIAEQGLGFVAACFAGYWKGCLLIPLLYIAGVIWSLLRHRKQEAMIFVIYTIVLLLTVYNPFLIRILLAKMDADLEYYRFFWILPVIPGAAYYMVRIIFSVRKRILAVGLTCVFAVLVVCFGAPADGIVTKFQMIENIYKVPDDLRAVCDVIHQDSAVEMPRVVFDSKYNGFARQYDPSMILSIKRNAQLVRAGLEVVDVDTNSRSYKRQAVIMDALYYGQTVKKKKFKKALKKLKVDYIVIPQISLTHDFVKACGCVEIARTQTRIVYRTKYAAGAE